jgi:molybdopterin converting factor small subunit
VPRIHLKYLAPLCDIAGRWEEEIETPAGTSLIQVTAERAARYGRAYRKLFFAADGAFRPMFVIMRNDVPMSEFDIPVNDGDRFTFIPPIAGG